MQGGIKLKPGFTYIVKDVPKDTLVKAYGYVPRAIAYKGNTLEFQESSDGTYKVTIHSQK